MYAGLVSLGHDVILQPCLNLLHCAYPADAASAGVRRHLVLLGAHHLGGYVDEMGRPAATLPGALPRTTGLGATMVLHRVGWRGLTSVY